MPSAKEGVLDVRGWDFKNDGPVTLKGEWAFYWKQLLNSADFKANPNIPPQYPEFPALWHELSIDGKPLPADGFATYRLIVLKDSAAGPLALEIPDFYTSYYLWVNGQLISENGTVGKTAAETTPYWLPATKHLPPMGDSTEIILQIANFYHSKGGPSNDIVLGDSEALMSSREIKLALDLLLAGSLIMGGLFFLGLFLFGQKEKYVLFFSLFCLVYTYRVLGYGLYFIHSMFPGADVQLTIHLEYLTLFLSTALFAEFVFELYPEETSKLAMRALQAVCLVLSLITLFLPAKIFTLTVTPFFILLVVYLFYTAFIFIKAAINKRDGANYAVLSMLMIMVAIFLTMLSYYRFLPESPFFSFIGYLGFFAFQSLILSYRFAQSFKRSARAAEAGAKAKSKFLATVSHEIRTPMNGVIGMTGLLLDTNLNKKQREYVETIRISGENLLTIINDILDFSRMESRKMNLYREAFDLTKCIEDVLVLLSSSANAKNLELIYYQEPSVPQIIVTDPIRLRQIMVNLVSNAIKFTEQGEVLVTVRVHKQIESECELQFEIKDTGIGIPENKVDQVFSSFSQIDSSSNRKYGGTGLGLAISKMLVEIMGGSIRVESEEGRGSSFYFTIQAQIGDLPDINGRQEPKTQFAGKRALVVDDNDTNLKILGVQLENWGIDSKTVNRPAEAETMLKEKDERFDFAIIDMQMPQMDGHELSSRIRQKYSNEELPIIILSSSNRARQDGKSPTDYTAYLTKPVLQSRLFNVINEVLDQENIEEIEAAEPLESDPPQYRTDLKILIAEDNIINQKVALKYLQRLGLQADIATNGREVLDALSRENYNLIFMDIQMPEMDGFETTKVINESYASRKPVIVAMTANAMKGDRDKCLAAGMDDYMTKPIRLKVLKEMMRNWFPDAEIPQT